MSRTPSTIVSRRQQRILEEYALQGLPAGAGGTHLDEIVPELNYTDVETKRIKSGYNSFITLGKDRNADKYSGGGGLGQTQCGAIDLVAGRLSSVHMKEPEKYLRDLPEGGTLFVENNFFADAARVYITQKAPYGIDEYLGFDNITHDPRDLSAVVIKSDCTRIVGRESVRIYTGSAKNAEGLGREGELRANGTPIESPRIELIGGGNDTDLQPAVLGQNLVDFVKENNKIISENIKTIIMDILVQMSEHNGMIAFLSAGGYGSKASVNIVQNIENTMSMFTDTLNEAINNINYLDDGLVPGKKSILSKRVFIT